MFEIQRVLTNVRPKNEEAVLTVTPTKGILKLSEKAAIQLGLTNESYASVLEANTDEGLCAFVFKGQAKNEDENLSQIGSKCSFSNNAMGGSLQFSSGNAWATLKGDVDSNTKYSVSEEAVVQGGVSYYKLTFAGKTPKTVKETSGEATKSNDLGTMVEVEGLED